jgi:hypothetical protein
MSTMEKVWGFKITIGLRQQNEFEMNRNDMLIGTVSFNARLLILGSVIATHMPVRKQSHITEK